MERFFLVPENDINTVTTSEPAITLANEKRRFGSPPPPPPSERENRLGKGGSSGGGLQLPNLRQTPIQGLQQELNELNERSLSDEEKWRLYAELFHRFFAHKRANSMLASTTKGPFDLQRLQQDERVKDLIFARFPTRDHAKVRHFLSVLTESLSWNDKGVVAFHGKSPIEGTHIADITDYLLRQRTKKPNWQPIGVTQVLSAALDSFPKGWLAPFLRQTTQPAATATSSSLHTSPSGNRVSLRDRLRRQDTQGFFTPQHATPTRRGFSPPLRHRDQVSDDDDDDDDNTTTASPLVTWKPYRE